LKDLQAAGVIGVALNVALLDVDFYRDVGPLLERLRDLGMWASIGSSPNSTKSSSLIRASWSSITECSVPSAGSGWRPKMTHQTPSARNATVKESGA